jgi:hypothetical protein
MVLNLRLRRALAWWLLAVMLMGALAPTVSRARAAAQGATAVTWMEVCTNQGMQKVAVSGQDQSAPDHVVVDHCPLCVLMADRLAPPPQPFVWQGLPQASLVFSVFAHAFTLTSRPWAVQSRAPPVFS